MTEYEESDEPVLSDEEKAYLVKMMENLQILIEAAKEPMDSKVLGLLEIAHDTLLEQLQLDKYYTWGPTLDEVEQVEHVNTNKPKGKKFLFIKEENEPPSAEELENWFN